MSIAEKLTTIAENQQKVYEAGQKAENERYWQKFWEGAIKSDNTCNLAFAFSGGGWNEETFSKIIYPSEKVVVSGYYSGYYVFAYFNRHYNGTVSQIDLTEFCQRVDFSKCEQVNAMFLNARAKNITIDLTSATSLSQTFSANNGGRIDNLTVKVSNNCTSFSNTFANQYSLKEIRFTEDSEIVASVSFVHSNMLSAESIQSIINALGTVTDSSKITFHSDVLAKLTTEQTAQIRNKGWVLG